MKQIGLFMVLWPVAAIAGLVLYAIFEAFAIDVRLGIMMSIIALGFVSIASGVTILDRIKQ